MVQQRSVESQDDTSKDVGVCGWNTKDEGISVGAGDNSSCRRESAIVEESLIDAQAPCKCFELTLLMRIDRSFVDANRK